MNICKMIVAVLTLVLSITAIPAFSEQRGSELKLQQNTGPSLEETTKFISNKINSIYLRVDESDSKCNADSSFTYKIIFDGCIATGERNVNFSIKCGVNDSRDNTSENKPIKIDLQKVTEVGIKLHSGFKNNTIYVLNVSPYIGFFLDDQSLGDRLVSAFNHARKLCGAKDEVF